MERIILDFVNCRSYDDIHGVVADAFGFDEDCGRNFDAMWDEMSTSYAIADNVKIFIRNLRDMGLKNPDMKEYSDIL